MLQKVVSFTQAKKDTDIVNKNWLLMDTCSTASMCNNLKLVKNVRECSRGQKLKIYTNGGELKYDKVVDFIYLPMEVHYNEGSIANVLSLKDITNIPGVHVTMDTLKEKAMLVHLLEGKKKKFRECDEGLYFYDTSSNNNKNKYKVNKYSKKCQRQGSLFTTIEENKIMFTKEQINKADFARSLQEQMQWPSDQLFRRYIKENLINTCKVTESVVHRAEKITANQFH